MSGMKCPYYTEICGIDPRRRNVVCHGDCSMCSVDGMFEEERIENVPSISKTIELYWSYSKSLGVRHITARNKISCVRRIAYALGVSMESPFTAISSTSALKRFAEISTGRLAQATIAGSVEAVETLAKEKTRELFHSLGYILPKVNPPKIQNTWKGKYVSLSESVRMQLRSLYEDLLHDEPSLWMIMNDAWYYGMRVTDSKNGRWSDFVTEGSRVTRVFRPHKTLDSSRATVLFPTDATTWMRICKARERMCDGGECVFRKNVRGSDAVADTDIAKNWRLAARLTEIIRNRIPHFRNTYKCLHELRKDRSQQLIDKYGIEEAAKLLGDAPDMLRAYYSDRHRVTVVPDPI